MRMAVASLLAVYLFGVSPGLASDEDRQLTIGGVIAWAGKGERLRGVSNDGQAVPIQPVVSFQPNQSSQFSAKLGFSAGNGVNPDRAFNLCPWAADLEDDVQDINGRNRDYLLTAWYKYSARGLSGSSIGVTFGIIDATDYLDENVFSNDEYSQFMNEALVNSPNAFLPSYDIGTALELEIANWALRGVYMNVGKNDDGNNFNFAGLQVGFRMNTILGQGNYRIMGAATDEQFLDPAGNTLERRAVMLTSFDQELGPALGAYIRFALQDDQAAVDYRETYSGGIDIKGMIWGRGSDNIGIGYALLNDGNGEIQETQVAELYYQLVLNDALAVTADVQYMADDYRANEVGPSGWILGLRMTAGF